MMIQQTSDAVALFANAMIGLDEEEQLDCEPTVGWPAIVLLHRLASREVLEASLAACADPDPLRRRVGAAVLGQLGHLKAEREPVFAEKKYQGLGNLLAAEREGPGDLNVLNEVCVALGYLSDSRAIPALLELREHPDAHVRFGVTYGLAGHETQEAIDGLIALSSDSDDEVRDRSTFAIGQLIPTHTPAIRAAFHARLEEPCFDARNEAIEGLALRGDVSVLPFLIRELLSSVALPLLNAAIALATPDLCKALAATATEGLIVQALHGPYDLTETWTEAMRACGCKLPDIPVSSSL
jgi:HEAT repeat protein